MLQLITSISVHDGTFLSEYLLFKGYYVIGISRSLEDESFFWRLEKLGLLDRIKIDSSDKTCKDY